MKLTENQLRSLVMAIMEGAWSDDDAWEDRPEWEGGEETEFAGFEDLSEPSYGERDDDDLEARAGREEDYWAGKMP